MDYLWPEDSSALFDVRESVVNVAIGAVVQLVPADPQRIALIAQLTTAANLGVTTNQAPASGQGYLLSGSGSSSMQVLNIDSGPLASQQWFLNNRGGAAALAVTVFQVILRRKPQPQTSQGPSNVP